MNKFLSSLLPSLKSPESFVEDLGCDFILLYPLDYDYAVIYINLERCVIESYLTEQHYLDGKVDHTQNFTVTLS